LGEENKMINKSKKWNKGNKKQNIEWNSFAEDIGFRTDTERNPESCGQMFYNNFYTVIKTILKAEDSKHPDLIHLSIRTNDRSTRHDWREFQLIKNELIGKEEECVELYPAESRLVDASNQYHLWCFKGLQLGFGFHERLVSETHENPKVVQRPFSKHTKPDDLVHITLDMEKKKDE
jgi:hypothetical protein